jgi:hypothetical protein
MFKPALVLQFKVTDCHGNKREMTANIKSIGATTPSRGPGIAVWLELEESLEGLSSFSITLPLKEYGSLAFASAVIEKAEDYCQWYIKDYIKDKRVREKYDKEVSRRNVIVDKVRQAIGLKD